MGKTDQMFSTHEFEWHERFGERYQNVKEKNVKSPGKLFTSRTKENKDKITQIV